MFNGLFGIGRAYQKLPPHHNFKELADNVERLADYLMDSGLSNISGEGHIKAPDRWQQHLGKDLKMLLLYVRDFVPPDTDGLHYFSTRGRAAGSVD
jgi:hypothetical protein